jgi:hypothetical protein
MCISPAPELSVNTFYASVPIDLFVGFKLLLSPIHQTSLT